MIGDLVEGRLLEFLWISGEIGNEVFVGVAIQCIEIALIWAVCAVTEDMPSRLGKAGTIDTDANRLDLNVGKHGMSSPNIYWGK